MFRFKGFKASLNFLSGSQPPSEHYEDVPVVCTTGAYRINRDELFGNGTLPEPPKKITPSMVHLPHTSQTSALKPSKSTSDLIQNTNLEKHKSVPDISRVSQDPRGGPSGRHSGSTRNAKPDKNVEKQQKKLDKQKAEEQKKRDKLAAQEEAKQEKLRKEREKVEAKKREQEAKKQEKEAKAKASKDKGKKVVKPALNPLARSGNLASQQAPPQPQQTTQYSTNTLESSISKTSGPPAYEDTPKQPQLPKPRLQKNEDVANVSFGSRIEEPDSWDLISQHRQQMSRPAVSAGGRPKQMVMDLQFNRNASSDEINV